MPTAGSLNTSPADFARTRTRVKGEMSSRKGKHERDCSKDNMQCHEGSRTGYTKIIKNRMRIMRREGNGREWEGRGRKVNGKEKGEK